MKMIMSCRLPACFQKWQNRILLLVLVSGVVLLGAGCGKKENPAPPTTTTATNAQDNTQPTTPSPTQPTAQSTTPVTPPPPQAGPPVATSTDADIPAIQQLNRAVISYRMQYHRTPSSVDDVASYAHIQLPAPPPGKKYAFNGRGLIVLVDNTAK